MPAIPSLHLALSESQHFQPRRLLDSLTSTARRLLSRSLAPITLDIALSPPTALQPRQNAIAIPTVYQGLNAGPTPAALTGI
ncbi:hypothetical protein LTR28_011562, partial [Elasticomyces elasticus]